jgi:hypothetical protein
MKTPRTSEDRITLDPDICNGKPTIRGRRITVQTILEFLEKAERRSSGSSLLLRKRTSMPAWRIEGVDLLA